MKSFSLLLDVPTEFPANGWGGCPPFELRFAAGPYSGHHATHRYVWLGRRMALSKKYRYGFQWK